MEHDIIVGVSSSHREKGILTKKLKHKNHMREHWGTLFDCVRRAHGKSWKVIHLQRPMSSTCGQVQVPPQKLLSPFPPERPRYIFGHVRNTLEET